MFGLKFKAKARELIEEAVLTGLALLLIWGIDHLLRATVGRETLLLGFVPVRLLVEAAHVLVLLRFILRAALAMGKP